MVLPLCPPGVPAGEQTSRVWDRKQAHQDGTRSDRLARFMSPDVSTWSPVALRARRPVFDAHMGVYASVRQRDSG